MIFLDSIYKVVEPNPGLELICPNGKLFVSREYSAKSYVKERCSACWHERAECSGDIFPGDRALGKILESQFHVSYLSNTLVEPQTYIFSWAMSQKGTL